MMQPDTAFICKGKSLNNRRYAEH